MAQVELDKQGSARIQIMQHPPGLPGHCAVCGYAGGENRQFVDFGLSVDFYGGVFFCDSCCITMANVFGFVTPEIYDATANQLQEAVTELVRLELENDRLRTAFDILSPTDPNSSSGRVFSSEVSVRTIREDVDKSTGSDTISTEPVSKQGPDDLSGSTGDEPSESESFGL